MASVGLCLFRLVVFAYRSRAVYPFSHPDRAGDSSPPAFPYNKNKDCIEYGREEHMPIDAHSSELRLVAQAQGQTPDEPAYEVTALLLANCIGGDLRRSDNPGRARVNRRRLF